MRILRVVLIWLAVIGAGYFAYKFIWPLLLPEKVETDIQTAVVQREDMRKVVPADGVIEPSVLVEVKSKASGVVEELMIEPGDTVKEGDVLVELDKEQLLARQRQAEASLSQARSSLKRAEKNTTRQAMASAESSVRQAQIARDEAQEHYDRISELYSKGFATEDEMVTAESSLSAAEERLEQAQTQLELEQAGGEEEDIDAAKANVEIRQAELDDVLEELANTTVRAPISGTVLTRPVELGTAVRSGTSGNSEGSVVATIGDLSTMYVRAKIEETDLGKVELGSSCRISFDAYPGWLWLGKITKLYPQGSEGQSGTQFEIDIEIDQHHATREGGGRGGFGGGDGEGGGGGMRRIRMGSLAPQNWYASAALSDIALMQGPPPGSPPPGGGDARPPAGSPPGAKEGAKQGKGQGKDGGSAAKPPALYPKMTANVEIVLEDHPGVMVLAAKFIQYGEDGKQFVEVLPDPEDQTKRERRDIETGFTDGMRFEITSGLEEGDTVILERPIEEEENMRMF
jgi:HlyD family secretion protein